MNESYGNIVIHYAESAAIRDPKTGTYSEGEQHVVVIKAMGDGKEYSFPLSTADIPGEKELDQWQKEGKLVIVTCSSINTTSFEHQAKDAEGNVKKYPKPGKMYKAGNKQLEIGTMLMFQPYAIRLATADDEARAKQAYGRYMEKQQEIRMLSIEGKQLKAKERTKKRIADAASAKKAS